MSLILEDFDLDEEAMKINDILSIAPIEILPINEDDTSSNKSAEDQSKEITDLLSIDDLIDQLDQYDDLPSSDNDDEDTINLTIKEPKQLDVKLISKDIDNAVSDLFLTIRKDAPKKDISSNEKELSLKILPNDRDKELSLSVKNGAEKKDTIEKDSSSDKEIKIKLVNTSGTSDKVEEVKDDKRSVFIQKRDEILSSKDPNLQLSICIKTIITLKESLDRLISHIPNENILVRTKQLIGEMLENIITSSNMILKDPERVKKIVYKVFDLMITLNDYIITKYNTLEQELSNSSKDQEDQMIKNQIEKVDQVKKEKEQKDAPQTNNGSNIDATSSQSIDSSVKSKKTPNINKKKL